MVHFLMWFPADIILESLILLVAVASGVARTSPLLGHSMGTLRLYELPREVQGDVEASSPPKFTNFTASQVSSEAIYRSEV